jgi:antitoxin component of MazEF toxin-antitoxin module
MKTKIVKIGNAPGVRIPKRMLAKAGLEEDVELQVIPGGILIRSAHPPRQGWAEAAELLRSRQEDAILDEPLPTDFDRTEWVW